MERRTLIQTAAVGVAAASTGCIDRFTDDEDDVESVEYQVEGREVDDDRTLHHDVSLTQSRLRYVDSALELEVTLSNNGDEAYTYGERRQALFWTKASQAFYLLPRDVADVEWNPGLGYWTSPDGFLMTEDYQTAALDPGESHTESLVLVVRHPPEENAPEHPPDALEFETDFREYHGAEPDFEEGGVERSWGFTLESRG